MRRALWLIPLLASSVLAQSVPLTPLRIAVIHKSSAPSVTPGDCVNGTSPNVKDDSTGVEYTCINSGSSDYYSPLPLACMDPTSGFTASFDASYLSADATYTLQPGGGALAFTSDIPTGEWSDNDPVIDYQPPTVTTGGGIRVFAGSTAAVAPVAYFTVTQNESTGVVTFDAADGSANTFTFSDSVTATVNGNASTATALAANGANCSAGSGAGGVSASGAAEDCTAYQPSDADLTAVAALTTTAHGLGLLDDADAAASRATVGALYTIQISHQNISVNPADASTYYCGYQLNCSTTQGLQSKMYLVKAGIIRAAEITISTAGATNGTNEDISCYVRLNNTTDTLIATVGTTDQDRQFRNASLAITVAAGDYVELKCVYPTWATNPLSVKIGGYLLVE